MRLIVADFETRSSCDLLKEGLKRYSVHPSTDILMLGYMEHGKPESLALWEPGMPNPDFCMNHEDIMLYCFNSAFESAIWNEVGVKKHGWKPLKIENVTCLAALANRYGLPNNMGDVAEALGCQHQKNADGKALIQVFCTPKEGFPGAEDPRWDRFKQYCLDDVLAESDILSRLPSNSLSPTERWAWEATEAMNNKGIPVDVASVKQIRKVSERYREEQFALLPGLTGGAVSKITQVKRIKDYCATRNVELDDLTSYTVQEILEQDLPDDVTQLLEMRAALGLSSIGKYIRLEDMSYEGRSYNNQRYYGAHTGRWTGSGVQLLNLPRASIYGGPEAVEDEIQKYFDGRILEENPIKSARALIRPMIKASDGKMLAAADYSSIEYVVLEWFAGNYEALERFDKGLDPYIDLAAVLYATPYNEIDKTQRQLGKVGILGCGYGSGWLTLMGVADKSYKVKLTEMEAQNIVTTYRKQHNKVSTMWYKLAEAAVLSVANPGKEYSLYHVAFKVVKDRTGASWLTIKLPSGRMLYYRSPFLEQGSRGPVVCHWGFIQKIKKWGVMRMIPGRIAENIVQAASRDILVHGMQNMEKAGLACIWTCYDECIIEYPEESAQQNYDMLVKCMCDTPEWAKEIPVKADGFIAQRYKKN